PWCSALLTRSFGVAAAVIAMLSGSPSLVAQARADRPPTPIIVVTPPGYTSSTTSFPTLYLFNVAYPGCTDATCAKLKPFLDYLRQRPLVSILLVNGFLFGQYVNWRDGGQKNESLLADSLIPWVDTHYRTVGDRAHRAVAGISAGGYGAMIVAARRPELFLAAATLSGVVDITRGGPPMESQEEALEVAPSPGSDPGPPLFSVFGNPYTDEVWWHDMNPTDLAANLRGTAVFQASGNGVPCDRGDVVPPNPAGSAIEAQVHDQNQQFDAALTGAGVAHAYRQRPCGVHSYRYFFDDFRYWYQGVLRFGARAPRDFDYRSADASMAAWDWRIQADPRRTPEFLSASAASDQGVTLTGSGLTTVTTARLFPPGQPVTILDESSAVPAHADSEGRLHVGVSLGPPHTIQQYRLPEPVMEAAGGYFRTRTIQFVRQESPLTRDDALGGLTPTDLLPNTGTWTGPDFRGLPWAAAILVAVPWLRPRAGRTERPNGTCPGRSRFW
ncbi:MAG: esterase family protein, partial [Candidatus Dormibacteraeota bacterium]|nr:esterase family protein [Candidatus Dormibacteraeota bacterium]